MGKNSSCSATHTSRNHLTLSVKTLNAVPARALAQKCVIKVSLIFAPYTRLINITNGFLMMWSAKKLQCNDIKFTLGCALFFTLLNALFIQRSWQIIAPSHLHDFLFAASVPLV